MLDVFVKRFAFSQSGSRVLLKIRAYGTYALYVNRVKVCWFSKTAGDWKKVRSFDITGYINQDAENSITACVGNHNGPPLLWLRVDGLEPHIGSDPSWLVSSADSMPVQAVIADDTMLPPGSLAGPGPWPSLLSELPLLTVFFICSLGAFLFAKRLAAKGLLKPKAVSVWALAFVALALGYTFGHNLPRLPWWRGFDVKGHVEYIKRLADGGGLPLATDGWEMYNPPLFYALAAAIYKVFCLMFRDAAYSFYGLKVISFASGIGQAALAYIASGLVFPAEEKKRAASVVFAGALPMNMYMSQYISNESLAAMLASASLVCAFWIIKKEKPSATPFILLGFLLGATLLTKMTVLVLIPVIILALIADCVKKKAGLRKTAVFIACALVPAALVCGWFYIRNWIYFGNPFITNMDPATGVGWWMDPGFHTFKYFTGFGMVFKAPFFSGFHSFWDGIYSTLWGDALCGGSAAFQFRPGWNYNFMPLVYLLSVPASIAILTGIYSALRNFVMRGDVAGLLIFAPVCLFGFAITTLALEKPYYAIPKAFYGLFLEVPLALAFATGIGRTDDWLKDKGFNAGRAVLYGWFGTLVLSILFAFYI